MKKYTYFVSFNYNGKLKSGYGNLHTVRTEKIEDIKDVVELSRKIEIENNIELGSVVILNFILLKEANR